MFESFDKKSVLCIDTQANALCWRESRLTPDSADAFFQAHRDAVNTVLDANTGVTPFIALLMRYASEKDSSAKELLAYIAKVMLPYVTTATLNQRVLVTQKPMREKDDTALSWALFSRCQPVIDALWTRSDLDLHTPVDNPNATLLGNVLMHKKDASWCQGTLATLFVRCESAATLYNQLSMDHYVVKEFALIVLGIEKKHYFSMDFRLKSLLILHQHPYVTNRDQADIEAQVLAALKQPDVDAHALHKDSPSYMQPILERAMQSVYFNRIDTQDMGHLRERGDLHSYLSSCDMLHNDYLQHSNKGRGAGSLMIGGGLFTQSVGPGFRSNSK